MKLYTEEQVKQAMSALNDVKYMYHSSDEIFDSLTPIQLPSDEEIEDKANKRCWTISDKIMFENGAKWVIEQTKQQDNVR